MFCSLDNCVDMFIVTLHSLSMVYPIIVEVRILSGANGV